MPASAVTKQAAPLSAPTDPLLGHIFRGADKRYYRLCPHCRQLQSYQRRRQAQAAVDSQSLCKPCANRTTENTHRGYYRDIRISWYNRVRSNAEGRRYVWLLTMDILADCMERQHNCCALTGWHIRFPDLREQGVGHASVDRINSDGDYTPDNIQLLDKRINMMKQAYSQEFFIAACRAVAAHCTET